MSTFTKTRHFSTVREVNTAFGPLGISKESYVVIRKRSFSEEGGANKIQKIEEMDTYSLC